MTANECSRGAGQTLILMKGKRYNFDCVYNISIIILIVFINYRENLS